MFGRLGLDLFKVLSRLTLVRFALFSTVGIFATLYFVLGVEINFFAVFVSHIAFGVGGYMFLVVIGVAVILLPMFGLVIPLSA
jgi:hypothetical protein